ncbi:AAA family ATPase, partial [Streptomyces pharetrae]
MTTTLPDAPARQIDPPEDRYATELAFLAAYDDGRRPPAWR